MPVFDELKKGGAVIVELPIYRELEVVLRMAKMDVDGFLIPDVPTGRVGPDGLALLCRLSSLGPNRFILAQASGRRDMCSNLSRIKGGLLIGVDTFYIVYGDVEKRYGVKPTELMAEMKRKFPEAHIGAAISPGRPGEDRLLKKKLRVGVNFFITQICFDAKLLLNLVREAKLKEPLLVALAINFGLENLKKMEGLGIQIPKKVREKLSLSKDPRAESINLAYEVYKEVSENYDGPLGAYLVPFGDVESFEGTISIFK